MYTYFKESKKIFEKIIKTNKTSIKKASDLISECILKDTIIHAFGTGHSHMVGLELFIRAGGLANVNAMLDSTTMTSEGAQRSAEIERIEGFSKVIWDQHKINKGDIIIIISNSGRNAMPIEMAMIGVGLLEMAIGCSRRRPTRNPCPANVCRVLHVDMCAGRSASP